MDRRDLRCPRRVSAGGVHPLVRAARSFKTGTGRITQAGDYLSNLRKRVAVIHDPAQVIAFVTFSAVVAGTPGPSNALLTAVGANAGVRRGLPSLLGQVTGMGAMLFAITLGLGNVLLAHPLALEILKWGGAAMLCWMAWRIATAGSAEGLTNAPTGFFGMAAFQWVNPKGWLVGVAAIATFLDRRAGGDLRAPVLPGGPPPWPPPAGVRRRAPQFPPHPSRPAHPQRRHGGSPGRIHDPAGLDRLLTTSGARPRLATPQLHPAGPALDAGASLE